MQVLDMNWATHSSCFEICKGSVIRQLFEIGGVSPELFLLFIVPLVLHEKTPS